MEECPYCHQSFDAVTWVDGECPGCGTTYKWDSAPVICWGDLPKQINEELQYLRDKLDQEGMM